MAPTWPAPHNNLANVYLAQGRKQEAIAKFESSIQTSPKNPSAYLSLALLYETEREYKKAMDVYERALAQNPNFWFAANNLAFLIAENSQSKADYERALELALGALKIRPGDPAILDTLGWVHFRLGNYSQAGELIEQALVGAADAAIINYHMGMVHYQNGEKEAAVERLQKALESEGDFHGRDTAESTLKELG
jgi:tetratricopeptide (TPR) repeat protein